MDMKEVLSRHEWILMEALWHRSPLFLSEIMEATKPAVDWNSSSYSTYLKRMTDKGFVTYKTISGYRCYSPLLAREDCIETETSYILSKMTEDSRRLLVASMIEKSGLSEKDRAELQALIARLNAEAKKEDGHENT
jgi:BlaI family penicillinase repressor